MAYNCIYQVAQYNDQLVHLALQEAYYKPILTFGIAGMTHNAEQLRKLNCCWHSVCRRKFGFNSWGFIGNLVDLTFQAGHAHCCMRIYCVTIARCRYARV
jgi:hypothetical protein